MKQPYLECGKIINLHGFRGAVKMESYCDTRACWHTSERSGFAKRTATVP